MSIRFSSSIFIFSAVRKIIRSFVNCKIDDLKYGTINLEYFQQSINIKQQLIFITEY